MTTSQVLVERIDIVEGPNLDDLTQAFKFATPRDQLSREMFARFNLVTFYGVGGEALTELGRTFMPRVIGIRYLANEASPQTKDDFVITVEGLGETFTGHYNTHSRKGSLSV